MERIVVGIDGSAAARHALRWAAAEAEKRGAVLDVVHAYRVPYLHKDERGAFAAASYGGLSSVDFAELARRREEELRRAHDQALGRVDRALERVGVDTSKVQVEPHAVAVSHPEHALIDMSRDAALLVVGSRGRGAVAGRLLGSVSRACVEHAHCPVVVLPATAGSEEAEA
jgi:nucleotide-binding universal stress UspA family protein